MLARRLPEQSRGQLSDLCPIQSRSGNILAHLAAELEKAEANGGVDRLMGSHGSQGSRGGTYPGASSQRRRTSDPDLLSALGYTNSNSRLANFPPRKHTRQEVHSMNRAHPECHSASLCANQAMATPAALISVKLYKKPPACTRAYMMGVKLPHSWQLRSHHVREGTDTAEFVCAGSRAGGR